MLIPSLQAVERVLHEETVVKRVRVERSENKTQKVEEHLKLVGLKAWQRIARKALDDLWAKRLEEAFENAYEGFRLQWEQRPTAERARYAEGMLEAFGEEKLGGMSKSNAARYLNGQIKWSAAPDLDALLWGIGTSLSKIAPQPAERKRAVLSATANAMLKARGIEVGSLELSNADVRVVDQLVSLCPVSEEAFENREELAEYLQQSDHLQTASDLIEQKQGVLNPVIALLITYDREAANKNKWLPWQLVVAAMTIEQLSTANVATAATMTAVTRGHSHPGADALPKDSSLATRLLQPVWSARFLLIGSALFGFVILITLWREQAFEQAKRELDTARQQAVDHRSRWQEEHTQAQAARAREIALAKLLEGPTTEQLVGNALNAYDTTRSMVSAEPLSRSGLAEAATRLARTFVIAGESKRADEAYRHAAMIFEDLCAEWPSTATYLQDLAAVYSDWALLKQERGDFPEADRLHRLAVEKLAVLVSRYPANAVYRSYLAGAQHNRATILQDMRGRGDDAETVFRAALTVRKQLMHEYPNEPRYRRAVAVTRMSLGAMLKMRANSDKKEAEDLLESARAELEDLVVSFPTIADYRCCLANAYDKLSGFRRADDIDKAVSLSKLAIHHQEWLVQAHPGNRRYARTLAIYYGNRSRYERDRGAFTEALVWARLALDKHVALSRYNLNDREWQDWVRKDHKLLFEILLVLRDYEAAEDCVKKFIPELLARRREDHYRLASLLAEGATKLEKDADLPDGHRARLVKAYDEHAVRLVRRGWDTGFRHLELLENGALSALRSRPYYSQLLREAQQLDAPAKAASNAS
jgi:tetratricopeptide (TPR) repeat protein